MKLVINRADVEFDGRYAKTPLPTPPAFEGGQRGIEAVRLRRGRQTRPGADACAPLIPSASLVI